jgi:hypothetical protein
VSQPLSPPARETGDRSLVVKPLSPPSGAGWWVGHGCSGSAAGSTRGFTPTPASRVERCVDTNELASWRFTLAANRASATVTEATSWPRGGSRWRLVARENVSLHWTSQWPQKEKLRHGSDQRESPLDKPVASQTRSKKSALPFSPGFHTRYCALQIRVPPYPGAVPGENGRDKKSLLSPREVWVLNRN